MLLCRIHSRRTKPAGDTRFMNSSVPSRQNRRRNQIGDYIVASPDCMPLALDVTLPATSLHILAPRAEATVIIHLQRITFRSDFNAGRAAAITDRSSRIYNAVQLGAFRAKVTEGLTVSVDGAVGDSHFSDKMGELHAWAGRRFVAIFGEVVGQSWLRAMVRKRDRKKIGSDNTVFHVYVKLAAGSLRAAACPVTADRTLANRGLALSTEANHLLKRGGGASWQPVHDVANASRGAIDTLGGLPPAARTCVRDA
jgi:hypothetical protein